MCSGAIYWAGIGRVVFGLSEREMKQQIGANQENPRLISPATLCLPPASVRRKSSAPCLRLRRRNSAKNTGLAVNGPKPT